MRMKGELAVFYALVSLISCTGIYVLNGEKGFVPLIFHFIHPSIHSLFSSLSDTYLRICSNRPDMEWLLLSKGRIMHIFMNE
jgi:hypothetical protein